MYIFWYTYQCSFASINLLSHIPMSVDFQEDQGYYRPNQSVRRSSPIVTWMLNKGIVNDEASGNKVLLVVSVIFFGVSIYFFTR
jgi:hypothetical protein